MRCLLLATTLVIGLTATVIAMEETQLADQRAKYVADINIVTQRIQNDSVMLERLRGAVAAIDEIMALEKAAAEINKIDGVEAKVVEVEK